MDLPLNPQGNLTFEVDNLSFTVVVDKFSTNYFNDSKNQLRVSYQPKIFLSKPLNAKDSPINISIIAKVVLYYLS